MIVFGSRMYGRKDAVRGEGFCDHCGNYVKHISYTGMRFGHLYFIPLLPLSGRLRVVKECGHCSRGTHLEAAQLPTLMSDLRERSESAIAALISGRDTMVVDGDHVPCVDVLVGQVDLLLSLNAGEYVDLTLEAMKIKELHYAYQVCKAEVDLFHGHQVAALEAYGKAAEQEPENAVPLISMAAIHFNEGRVDKASELYEKAFKFAADKRPVLFGLLEIYESQQDYALLATTYEALFDLDPVFAQDKKVQKNYKRALKKAGRTG